jgi:hypothetical protein
MQYWRSLRTFTYHFVVAVWSTKTAEYCPVPEKKRETGFVLADDTMLLYDVHSAEASAPAKQPALYNTL